jgi:glucose 1-dehydrogenase
MSRRLEGSVAMVTGADSGIGQAIAAAFAREGADVIIVFHSDLAEARHTRDLVEASNYRAAIRQADIRDQREVAELIDFATGTVGLPDILVNNAGVGAGTTPVAETTGDEWDRVIRTDLYGPFYCSRHFVQARKPNGGGGRIINITSVHEAIPSPNAAAYGAAKGGLLTLPVASHWKSPPIASR